MNPYDEATAGLIADIRAADNPQPDFATLDFQPEDDDEPGTLSGYVFEDDDGSLHAPTVDEAGEMVSSLSDRWSDLAPGEQELATGLAQELATVQREQHELEEGVEVLRSVMDDLAANDYEVSEFARLVTETGDLEHAINAIIEIGPIPRTVDEALDGYLSERRRDRDAESFDEGAA
jgi:hypothetical protein